MLTKPIYMPDNLSAAPIDFAWSDEIASSLLGDYDELPTRLNNAISATNYKANATLTLAALEWVIYRLGGHTNIHDALHRVEAAWASIIDKRYARCLDFDDVRNDVDCKGNPDGPLQTALCVLEDMHFALSNDRANLGLTTLQATYLAQLVLPTASGYEDWLRRTLEALTAAYPLSPSFVPYSDTYDHSAEPPIPRAWFESLTVPPNAAADHAAWDTFLRGLNPDDNPYLVPADEMRANGFVGKPYRMN